MYAYQNLQNHNTENTMSAKKKVSEMTINDYYKYIDILEETDGIERICLISQFMSGCTYAEAKNKPYIELAKEEASFYAISEDLRQELPKDSINILGRTFKFVYEPEKMIASQYIDFNNVRNMYLDNPKNIHAILATMCYEGDEYDGENNAEKEKFLLENMKMKDAYPPCFFLSAKLKTLNQVILPYFAKEYERMMILEMTSGKDGAGLSSWKGFVRFTTKTWTRFSAFVSLSFLIGGLILKNLMTRLAAICKK